MDDICADQIGSILNRFGSETDCYSSGYGRQSSERSRRRTTDDDQETLHDYPLLSFKNKTLMFNLDSQDILVTGGTGSFGKKFTEMVLARYKPNRLIILSRDELKQAKMKQRFSPQEHPCLRYFIGDVREKDRLHRAFVDVDIVIHAAALKRVPAAEYNPIEPIKTNVMGGSNVIEAAIDRDVDRVIALSTDKGANPVNLYGATKLCADKLFVAGNNYSGEGGTRFSVVRYGNVVGSRGSVIPFFLEKRRTGTLPITDPRMTRFWITLEQAVDFVLTNLDRMEGGEVFVPKIPSMKITELAEAIAPRCNHEIVGIRPGEKLHEVMVPRDVARRTLEFEDYYAILPAFRQWDQEGYQKENGGTWCEDQFKYSSDNNDRWLTAEEIREMIGSEKVVTDEHRESADQTVSRNRLEANDGNDSARHRFPGR